MNLFSNLRPAAWAIWIIASIFYAYQYVLRVMPNIMLDDIMLQFDISAATFGQFSGVYYIGYSLMHLPIGIMLDRLGPRKIMTACILLSVVGLMPLIFSDYWVYPIIGRLLLGIGSSAAILGIFKIVRMTFTEEQFSRMLSLSVTIGLLGAIYGGGPVSYMREMFGYQTVIQLFAVAGIILAITTYWLIPEVQGSLQGSVSSNIKEVLSNYRVIAFCFCAGMMVGPLEGFADVWGTAFLKHVYELDSTISASLPSLIFIGMCFGAPVLSLVAERAGNYLVTIIAAGSIMTAIFLILLTIPLTSSTLSLSFVLIGICCAYQILAIFKVSTCVREEVAGLATAVANMIIMIFGYAFHTTMGEVINKMGGPSDPNALFYGIAVIPAALCTGTCGFIILLATEKKPHDSATKELANPQIAGG
jgi:predicted MFS family arabinose efflux permease